MGSSSASATTGASRSALLALLLAAGCAPGAGPPGIDVETHVPAVRVGLPVGRDSVAVGGGDAIRLVGPDGAVVTDLPVGAATVLRAEGGGVRIESSGRVGALPLVRVIPAVTEGLLRVGGNEYRGEVTVRAGAQGLLAVNRVSVEEYLGGVVTAEMGRRPPEERAALEAQAIVSRTVALRAITRWRARDYDVLATVADQVYGGAGAETPPGREAVRTTRGMVLVFQGQLIEAFYHSTCGGRTAAGEEVFAAAGLPYLRSVPDAAPDGRSWCASSPRYRWSEQWTGAALLAAFGTALPAAGAGEGSIGEVRDVVITGRTGSGRVQSISVLTDRGSVPIAGPAIRRTLQPRPGELLRSAAFELQVTRDGSRLVRLTATGQGAGHGVGLCQWGAIGRARAGATAPEILSAYFSGARLERRW